MFDVSEKNGPVVQSVKKLLDQFPTIGLDTSILIYHLQENPKYRHFTSVLFHRIEGGHNVGILSALALAELLVKPYQENHPDVADTLWGHLRLFPHLRIIPIEENIAAQGAALRAKYRLDLPDAIHIACAIHSKAAAFLTNDSKLTVVNEIPISLVDQFI